MAERTLIQQLMVDGIVAGCGAPTRTNDFHLGFDRIVTMDYGNTNLLIYRSGEVSCTRGSLVGYW